MKKKMLNKYKESEEENKIIAILQSYVIDLVSQINNVKTLTFIIEYLKDDLTKKVD